LVNPDPNERADYHEIAKYNEISKYLKNIVGITEYEKLKQQIEIIESKIKSITTKIIN
jgi:hypothetical protein